MNNASQPAMMKSFWRMFGFAAAVLMIGLHVIVVMTTHPVSYTSYSALRLSLNVTYFHHATLGDLSTSDSEIVNHSENESISYTEPITHQRIIRTEMVKRMLSQSTSYSMSVKYNMSNSNTYLERFPSYDMISNVPGCDSDIFLVIVVCSTIDHFRHRDVIRRTWASETPRSVQIIFLVGLPSTRIATNAFNREYTRNRDMVFVNIPDIYDHLTLKSIAMLKWITVKCRQINYLLKVDDDTVVTIPKLLDSLRHVTHSYFIMGNIIAGAQPMRDASSKWHTPINLYSPSTYPDYVSGSAYVISGDLIEDLYHITQLVPFFWIEDIYITGLCTSRLNASLVHNSKFKSHIGPTTDSCMIARYLTIHRVQPDVLLKHWKYHAQKQNHCN